MEPPVNDPRFILDSQLGDEDRRTLIDNIEENIQSELLERFVDRQVIIEVDPTLQTPGSYDPDTNTITIRDINNIPAIKEEFFHAFQDRVYTDGIGDLVGPRVVGFTNMEFEAKLYNDLVQSFKLGGFGGSEAINNFDTDALDRYLKCLDEATHYWDNTQPIDWSRIEQDYDALINSFGTKIPDMYPPGLIDKNNKPLDAIKELF